jgi:trimeric autotransporter adhesin
MSTKTTFKRIALVAVAALGLGVLSVAPSSAAVSNLTVTITNGTAGLPNAASDSTTAALINVTGLMEANDSITVEVINDSYPTKVASSAGAAKKFKFYNLDSATPLFTSSTYVVDTLTAGLAAGSAAIGGTLGVATAEQSVDSTTVLRIVKKSTTANINQTFGVAMDSATTGSGVDTRTAGVYSYTVIVKAYGGASNNALPLTTIIKTLTITITAAADASKTPSAVTSFANLNSAAAAAQAAVGTDSVISSVATAGTNAGYIYVGNRNAANGVTTAEDSLTATVTGAGVVCSAALSSAPSATICGKSLKVSAFGDYQFIAQADGTAGASTIVVTSSVAGWTSSKSLSYYSKAAKTITATAFTPILGVGSNDSAVVVTAVDANGTNWTGTAYIVATAAADALIGGSATTPVACVLSTDKTKQYCPVSAISTGTANFTVIDASTVALATATSNAVAVKVSNASATSVKIAFDKATYAPFEKAIITVTPVDAAGNKIQAVSGNYLNAALTSNVALTIAGGSTATLPGASITTVAYDGTDKTAGSLSYVVYMPAGSGTVTLTGKGGAALPLAGQVAVTASADVVNSSVDAATDAANEATDAANAATDAALAAADAADAATAAAQDASDAVAALSASVSKLISSLRAQITSLTNLVIKIQKKVRA